MAVRPSAPDRPRDVVLVVVADPDKRVVGVRNRLGEIIFIDLPSYYVTAGIEEQLVAIEWGYVDE